MTRRQWRRRRRSDGAADVAVGADLGVTFSEPVNVAGSWFELGCDTSGAHPAAVSGGPTTFTLDPTTAFATGEGCSLTILASHVTDQDTNDPPNAMANDVIASFTTVAPPDEAPTVEIHDAELTTPATSNRTQTWRSRSANPWRSLDRGSASRAIRAAHTPRPSRVARRPSSSTRWSISPRTNRAWRRSSPRT